MVKIKVNYTQMYNMIANTKEMQRRKLESVLGRAKTSC